MVEENSARAVLEPAHELVRVVRFLIFASCSHVLLAVHVYAVVHLLIIHPNAF